MTFQVHRADQLSTNQMREFLEGSREIGITLENRNEVYEFLEGVLRHQHYTQLGKGDRGIIRAYLGL